MDKKSSRGLNICLFWGGCGNLEVGSVHSARVIGLGTSPSFVGGACSYRVSFFFLSSFYRNDILALSGS